MRISVVVPVHNARATIGPCVAALAAQIRPADVVYLVDNGSTDGTYEWLQERARGEPRLRVLRERKRGPSAARNAALRLVEDGIVAFTDADCVAEADWLERLATAYEDPAVNAVAGGIAGRDPRTLVERYLAMTGFSLPDRALVVRRCTPFVGFPTANLSVRAGVAARLGGFDEQMFVGEDYDLCWRIVRDGGAIVYIPGARVAHIHRASLAAMLARLFAYGAARPRLVGKHFRGRGYLTAGRRAVEFRSPVTFCVNLTSPEKVSLAMLLLSLASPWLLGCLALYWWRLAVNLRRAAQRRGVAPRSEGELLGFTGLHLLEFAASNAGSLSASARFRAFCV